MSTLARLASALGRNDEIPNVDLAVDIARRGDKAAVRQLIDALGGADRAVQNDAIKVLYEVGGRGPELICSGVDALIDGLASKNNRIVWGAMTALGTIAALEADRIWKRVDDVTRANAAGSVITQDWGIRVLASVAAKRPSYERKLFPYLLSFLKQSIPRDVPKHAESIMTAVNGHNKDAFLRILKARERQLKPAQLARVRKIQKRLDSR